MNPFFFGPSEEPLFGIYHQPNEQPARRVGVVVCNPFGDESIKAHRALLALARMLADDRFHVLRFDYFATGDSGGDAVEGTVDRWLADIGEAARELQDTAGVRKVSLVGLRFGASLALLAAREQKRIDRVVLWDPVVNGKKHLVELRKAHDAYVGLEFGEHQKAARIDEDELMGFPLTPPLRDAMEALDLTTLEAERVRRAAIVGSTNGEDYKALCARLTEQDVDVQFSHVPVGVNWNADEAMESSLVPKEALEALVAALGDGA